MKFTATFEGSAQSHRIEDINAKNVNFVDEIFINNPIDALFYDEIISPDKDCREDKRKLSRDAVIKEVIDSIIYYWNGSVKLFQYDLIKNRCHMDKATRDTLIEKGFSEPNLWFDIPAVLFVVDKDGNLRAYTVSQETGDNAKYLDIFNNGKVIAKITGNGLDMSGRFFAGRRHEGWCSWRSGQIAGFENGEDYNDPHTALIAGYLNKVSVELDAACRKQSMLSLICEAYSDMLQ